MPTRVAIAAAGIGAPAFAKVRRINSARLAAGTLVIGILGVLQG
jgi:hypothetical protein